MVVGFSLVNCSARVQLGSVRLGSNSARLRFGSARFRLASGTFRKEEAGSSIMFEPQRTFSFCRFRMLAHTQTHTSGDLQTSILKERRRWTLNMNTRISCDVCQVFTDHSIVFCVFQATGRYLLSGENTRPETTKNCRVCSGGLVNHCLKMYKQ